MSEAEVRALEAAMRRLRRVFRDPAAAARDLTETQEVYAPEFLDGVQAETVEALRTCYPRPVALNRKWGVRTLVRNGWLERAGVQEKKGKLVAMYITTGEGRRLADAWEQYRNAKATRGGN